MTPTRWIALTVRVPSEEHTEELAEGLVALGGAAVEQTGDTLTTYLKESADPDAVAEGAAASLRARMEGGGPLQVSWRWELDQDWSARWKEGLAPRRVGRRFVVTQPWNPVEDSADEVVLVIEPSSAFGTGEHATTRGALRLLEDAVAGGERGLDVGAGSAILSIAAAKLGAASMLAVESDPGAMDTARENVERAGLEDRVTLENAVVDAAYLARRREAGFDLVVANVLSGVLTPLLAPFRSVIRSGGRLILGGVMTEEAEPMRAAAGDEGWDVVEEDVEGGWWTALMRPS